MKKVLSVVLFTLVVAVGFSAYVTEVPAGIGGCGGATVQVPVSEVGPSAARFDDNDDGYVCAVENCRTNGHDVERCRWKVLSDNTFGGIVIGG